MSESAADRERIVAAHARFARALAGLSEATLTTQALCGTWCARDVVAHIAAWNDEILRAAQAAQTGRVVEDHPVPDAEAFNVEHARVRAGDAWPEVWSWLERTIDRSVALLETLEAEKRATPLVYPWGQRGTLGGLFHGIYEHEEEHSSIVEAWRWRNGR